MIELTPVEPVYLAAVMALAFASSIVGGISGFGAGLIITPFLLPVVGVKGVVPVVAVAMVVGNIARLFVYRDHLDRSVLVRMLLSVLPGSIAGVWLYAYLPATVVAVIIGTMLIASVPTRRYFARHRIAPSPTGISLAAFGCGLVSGNAPGAGVVIVSLLLSLGLSGPALIGTDALIGTVISLTNTSLFGGLGLLDAPNLLMGLAIGSMMIPGAFVARYLVNRMSARLHVRIIEIFVIAGGLTFYWASISQQTG